MGQAIEQQQFTAADYQRFEGRLAEQLLELRSLLQQPGFGQGEPTLGAEVELYLIDSAGQPVCRNRELCDALPGGGLTLEINRYNIESNLRPVSARGTPFSALEQQICTSLTALNSYRSDLSVIPIGILPTVARHHFGQAFMTDEPRYALLSKALRAVRGECFHIDIAGKTRISLDFDDVTLEGANTSMQLHLKVSAAQFADWFNAVQLVTPLVVALAANSPLLFGHRLWHETRIPLFRQSIDGRSAEQAERAVPSRVDFGSGWIRKGAYEIFASQVKLYPPILPVCTDRPEPGVLPELRLHSGTVWPWNRAVYDPADGGHLRIEMRALPAGPTARDMMANAALLIGLTARFAAQIDPWIENLPFETLSGNFYAAAREGLGAQLYWPGHTAGVGLELRPVPELARQLLPEAEAGLGSLGVDAQEIGSYLGVIEQRLARGQNGASWMLAQLDRLQAVGGLGQALPELTLAYREHSLSNRPVGHWPLV